MINFDAIMIEISFERVLNVSRCSQLSLFKETDKEFCRYEIAEKQWISLDSQCRIWNV